MTRPIYETEQDRWAEDGVAAAVGLAWKCVPVPTPPLSGIDLALMRDGNIKAFAEVKVRTTVASRYSDYMIGAKKWYSNMKFADECGVPMLLVVAFTDGIKWVPAKGTPVREGIGGRTDRNDPQDIKLCVFIDIGRFKKLKGVA